MFEYDAVIWLNLELGLVIIVTFNINLIIITVIISSIIIVVIAIIINTTIIIIIIMQHIIISIIVVKNHNYEKIILESELENCGVPQLLSISFLNDLLKDALEENDTSILTYTIEHKNDSGNECIRFVIKNSYRYGPYQFALDVPRKRLDENTNITLRLEKVLSENEQLRQSVVDTQAQLQNVITQFQPMVSELKYMRDLENFRHGFTIHITEDILNKCSNNGHRHRGDGPRKTLNYPRRPPGEARAQGHFAKFGFFLGRLPFGSICFATAQNHYFTSF